MKLTLPQSRNNEIQKVRVLIVAPSLQIRGGQAVQAQHLVRHLSDEPSVEVSFLPHNPRLPGPLSFLQSIKYVRTIVTSLLYYLMLVLRIPQYDVIHIFSASYFSFLLAPAPAVLIAKWFGKKTVLNYRSGEAEDHLRTWPRTSIPILEMADELVVPSEYLVNTFKKFGLEAKAIANVIDFERFRFSERQPLQPRFLSNRNLYPLYNIACILRAFRIIQEKFPEATLKIAGDGQQREYLKDLARDLGLRNVDFLGSVAPEEMSKLYDEAHIFLNSPNIDNLPGSILDSFASGVPVLTTCAGGIPYIVTHERTGLLVPRNDAEAMAASAIKLLESPELSTRIVRNAHRACELYSWSAVRWKWLNLYRQLTKQTVKADAQLDKLHQPSYLL
ncbi:MAG TPA: glycosyltransferase family 4 protein [Pyrinomonadaceae bacterium]|nr:glycosyltransferase family 4 protein [Pyrinomonadaceae bacterium]